MHDDELNRRIARLLRKISFFERAGNEVRAAELRTKLAEHREEYARRNPPVERTPPVMQTAELPVKRAPGRPRKSIAGSGGITVGKAGSKT